MCGGDEGGARGASGHVNVRDGRLKPATSGQFGHNSIKHQHHHTAPQHTDCYVVSSRERMSAANAAKGQPFRFFILQCLIDRLSLRRLARAFAPARAHASAHDVSLFQLSLRPRYLRLGDAGVRCHRRSERSHRVSEPSIIMLLPTWQQREPVLHRRPLSPSADPRR